jgi:hypothetical protein
MEMISAVKAMVWLALLLPLTTAPLVILRPKGCTAEINVIWYAFSLVFVIWWCLNSAIALNIIDLPWVDPAAKGLAKEAPSHGLYPAPWTGRYFYIMAQQYLTDTEAELGLVASVIIVAIAPQLLTYILSGLSGCASTPRLVWQFEKIAIWSLIKFLAAFGGLFAAEALDVRNFASTESFRESILADVESLLRGLTAVAVAFVLSVLQVYFLDIAQALGQAWQQKTNSWPYRVHRFFTRNLPRDEGQPSDEACSQPRLDGRPADKGRLAPSAQDLGRS